MKIVNLFKKKTEKLNKTHSMQFRFLTTVIFSMLAVAIFIGGISIYEVDKYILGQAKEFVDVTCLNEAAQINDSLDNMEKSVKIMESYLMDFFDDNADVEDRALQARIIERADQMFADVMKHTSTSGAIAYYFRFDPAISDNKAGLFYSKLNGGDEFVYFEPTDISLYDKNDTEHVGWFWQPYEAGEAIWMKPYHNLNNDILMISYVVPMYLDGRFIGVMGMDFDYMILAEQVHEIQIYENGFAHLESEGNIICSDERDCDLTSEVYSKDYLHVSKNLVNGMTLVLSASYDDIRHIRYEIAFKIIFIVLILTALFTVMAILVVKRIVQPLNQLTDASVKLSNGDYRIETVYSNTREIKLLSAAFEHMAICLREREEFLHFSATRDSLTGLRNTTSYKSWVDEFVKVTEGKDVDYGIVVLDLNDLKKTNDKYGHNVGNELIITAAKLIADVFKRSPVFRIGGDEFTVVLQNVDLENCEALFEQFELNCRNTFVHGNANIPVRIAYGFARFDPDRDTRFKDVFDRADEAMYENKRKIKAE